VIDKEEASRLTIEIAGTLVGLAGDFDPAWERAWFRFESDGNNTSANTTIEKNGEAWLIPTTSSGGRVRSMSELAEQMREHLDFAGRKFRVALVEVQPDLKFMIEYEFDDPNRWRMTKLGGASGFPK